MDLIWTTLYSYINALMTLFPVIIVLAAAHCTHFYIQTEKERKRERHEAVIAYSKQFGVSYDEADQIVYTPTYH